MGITPEQWERVKELYETALESSPTQRTAFLEQNERDEGVRAEVHRLLGVHDRLGSFLSGPPFLEPGLYSASSPQRLATGEVLAGRFRIANFIAAGGMGEVYKAEDLLLDRVVALKFLSTELAEDHESLERFRREAKAASALNHPNICTVYDFGEDSGRAFIAMEYLEGETLSVRLKKGPLSTIETLKVAITISGALGAAHRKGIVHRDLKPGNIMLTERGAMLLDFGLAKYDRSVASEETRSVLTADAQVVGTLPYMSPEQLRGQEIDARGDIFAFGAVLYEMLTGKRAFQRKSDSETVVAVDQEEPSPLQEFVKDVPDGLERIIRHCLRKRPEERYAGMPEIEQDLKDCYELVSEPVSGINLRVLFRQSKRPHVAIPALLVLLAVTTFGGWWVHHSSKVQWARDQALPQISKLIEQGAVGEAYALALQAERYIPTNPTLVKSWPDISWSDAIVTNPPGASVYRRNYNAPNSQWEFVGLSPIRGGRFPAVDSSWKFELQGYATVERATFPSGPITVTLHEHGKAPIGMIRVEFDNEESEQRKPITLWGIAGFEALPAVPMTAGYWVDKFEVTNAEFKGFVDQGGYEKQQYWKHEFRKDGHVLAWADAMKLFVDKTNKPGPATWIQGEYPAGEDKYPVAGVSWFEAEAYAEFAGKSLPTIYHWTVAASPTDSSSLVPASNFSAKGPSPVGTYYGMSWCGAYDMAGNVKEWCSNEASSGRRYIMGGAWDDPTYMFNDADARSPFERSPTFGFRCAKYVLNREEAKADAPITVKLRNYGSEKPVSDQLFKAYKGLYSYDKTPLNSKVESIEQTEDWREEKITFDAAYVGERVIAYLFLPKKASPPFQVVVHFPGAGAAHARSSAKSLSMYLPDFDFILKSGRAVLFPIYKGTFERGGGPKPIYWPNTTSSYRDNVIMWSKDLGRSIDYLETQGRL